MKVYNKVYFLFIEFLELFSIFPHDKLLYSYFMRFFYVFSWKTGFIDVLWNLTEKMTTWTRIRLRKKILTQIEQTDIYTDYLNNGVLVESFTSEQPGQLISTKRKDLTNKNNKNKETIPKKKKNWTKLNSKNNFTIDTLDNLLNNNNY